jgi:hypothetical protein
MTAALDMLLTDPTVTRSATPAIGGGNGGGSGGGMEGIGEAGSEPSSRRCGAIALST